MNKHYNPTWVAVILAVLTILIVAVLPVRVDFNTSSAQNSDAQEASAPESAEAVVQQVAQEESAAQTVEYTLRTTLGQTPPMAFMGVGGEIDGVINPTLNARVGDTVRITAINGDPVLHDLTITEFGVTTGQLTQQDQEAVVEFTPTAPGDYVYFCSVPGHRESGMWGTLRVEGEAIASAEDVAEAEPVAEVAAQPTVLPAASDAVSVVRNPSDLPGPLEDREPMNVRIDLTAQEVTGQLADGTTYDYFTFDGKIPGPFVRVRVGDTIELRLTNAESSLFPHSIDLHSVTGPGGGAVYTQTNPGEETSFSFKGLAPGLYVYHCATPSVAHHITSGMYGLILVEPEGGLPPVDREFYVMQGDMYTAEPFGTQGHLTFSQEAMLDEDPEYFVFNGAANALTTDENALRANVGETVRIFFGVGGPNATSSFHVIGEIFDRVYSQASLTAEPLTDVQTTTVPPGGATMVEFTLDVPGRYILVDHALARLERGLAGFLYAEGNENPEVFNGDQITEGSGNE